MADQKLCNMCQSRGYKRGYLGVYPKVSIEGVHNPKRYVELDNHEIRDFMEETVYSHPNKVETRYKPEKNWKETLSPNRTNEITNQEGSLTNRFIGFLMENLNFLNTKNGLVSPLAHSGLNCLIFLPQRIQSGLHDLYNNGRHSQ